MLHNQFEIDGAWVEGTVTSRKGDVAHMKVNSVTKEVWLKTRVGDGNFSEWRRTNTTYDACLSQGFTPLIPVVEPVISVAVVIPTMPSHNNGSSGLDLESVAPFGKRNRKHSE